MRCSVTNTKKKKIRCHDDYSLQRYTTVCQKGCIGKRRIIYSVISPLVYSLFLEHKRCSFCQCLKFLLAFLSFVYFYRILWLVFLALPFLNLSRTNVYSLFVFTHLLFFLFIHLNIYQTVLSNFLKTTYHCLDVMFSAIFTCKEHTTNPFILYCQKKNVMNAVVMLPWAGVEIKCHTSQQI